MFNQFTEQVFRSAAFTRQLTAAAAKQAGLRVEIDHLPDPRVEAEESITTMPNTPNSSSLGLKPHLLSNAQKA